MPVMRDTLVIILFVAAMVLFIGLVAYLFFQVGRFLWRLPGELKATRERAAKLTSRQAAMRILPVAEAERMARELLDKVAQRAPWAAPLGANLAENIDQLEPALAALLRQYRRIHFGTSDTGISAELMSDKGPPERMWVIGRTGDMGGEFGRRLLCAQATLPLIHEVLTEDTYGNGQRIIETYPSLFHYLLFVEAPNQLVAAAESVAEGLAANLIKSVLDGNILPEDALQRWPSTFNRHSTKLADAWTQLRHFADDSDLHAAEPGYLTAEKSKLRESLHRLSPGKPD